MSTIVQAHTPAHVPARARAACSHRGARTRARPRSSGLCFATDEATDSSPSTYHLRLHLPRLVPRSLSTKALSFRSFDDVCGSAATASAVTDATFEEEVLNSSVPVLVDFWAPWCGPCRMIAPLIDELATEYQGKMKAVKLNTDESPQVASQYGIRSIPTVMIFKDGEKLDTVIGAVPKKTLQDTLEKFMD